MQILVYKKSFGFTHAVVVQNWRHARAVMRMGNGEVEKVVRKKHERWHHFLSYRMYKKLMKHLKETGGTEHE